MGYFDRLADNAFKDGPKGEVLFYANGAISKGRVVPDNETRAKLFKFQKRNYKIAFFFGIPYGWLLGLSGIFTAASLLPLVLMMVYILYKQYTLTRGLKKHDLELGFGEVAEKGSQTVPNWIYWFVGVTSTLLIIMGVYSGFVGRAIF